MDSCLTVKQAACHKYREERNRNAVRDKYKGWQGTNTRAGKGQILDRSAANQRLYKYWAEDYITILLVFMNHGNVRTNHTWSYSIIIL